MGRKGLVNSGSTVKTGYMVTPCNISFSGSKRKVDMLFKLHKKVCKICQTLPDDININKIITKANIGKDTMKNVIENHIIENTKQVEKQTDTEGFQAM